MKKAYLEHDIVQEIGSAIQLLCQEYGHTSPTQVLRLLKLEETELTRTFVRDIAKTLYGFYVKSSGKGYEICFHIWIDDVPV